MRKLLKSVIFFKCHMITDSLRKNRIKQGQESYPLLNRSYTHTLTHTQRTWPYELWISPCSKFCKENEGNLTICAKNGGRYCTKQQAVCV